MTKNQLVDMDSLLEALQDLETSKERIDYLGQWYPCLAIYVMKKRGMIDELEKYMQKCKSYKNNW